MGRSLNERLSFEELIANLSARLVNLAANQVDREIEGAQRRVCEPLGLDLSGLRQVDPSDPQVMVLTHLYRPLGGPPLPSRMEALEYFPWGLEQIISGALINVPSTEDAPALGFTNIGCLRLVAETSLKSRMGPGSEARACHAAKSSPAKSDLEGRVPRGSVSLFETRV